MREREREFKVKTNKLLNFVFHIIDLNWGARAVYNPIALMTCKGITVLGCYKDCGYSI